MSSLAFESGPLGTNTVHLPPPSHIGSSHLGSMFSLNRWKSTPDCTQLGGLMLLYRLHRQAGNSSQMQPSSGQLHWVAGTEVGVQLHTEGWASHDGTSKCLMRSAASFEGVMQAEQPGQHDSGILHPLRTALGASLLHDQPAKRSGKGLWVRQICKHQKRRAPFAELSEGRQQNTKPFQLMNLQ